MAMPLRVDDAQGRFRLAHNLKGQPTVYDADRDRFVVHEGEWTENLAQLLVDDLNRRPRAANALTWVSASEMEAMG